MFLPLVAINMSRNCKYLCHGMTITHPLQSWEQVPGQSTGAQTQSWRVAVQPRFLSYLAEKDLTNQNGISGERKKPSWIEPSPRTGSGHPVCHAGPSSSAQPQHTFRVQTPCFAVTVTWRKKHLPNADVKKSWFETEI